VLHNNIGIAAGDGNTSDVSAQAWDRILNVNLTATWATCRQVIPHMRQRRSGVILNVSSIAAVCAVPLAAYKVSKAGVNALTQALTMDNASYGIRVNAIMPGLIDTPMAIEGYAQATGIDQDAVRTARDKMVPLGNRQGTAWDVAHAALFLASDEASFITGALLPRRRRPKQPNRLTSAGRAERIVGSPWREHLSTSSRSIWSRVRSVSLAAPKGVLPPEWQTGQLALP
jgi:NAD(P)-dependent dehydrogenase (short-subunit alcohol dehydrogenase family)